MSCNYVQAVAEYIYNDEERADPELGRRNATAFLDTYEVGVGASGIVWARRRVRVAAPSAEGERP